MAEAPLFKGLQQSIQIGGCGTDFPQVIDKAAAFVIGDGVFLFADISEDAEQPFTGREAHVLETATLNCQKEHKKRATVLGNELFEEIAGGESGEFCLEFRRELALEQGLTKFFGVRGAYEVEEAGTVELKRHDRNVSDVICDD